MEGWAGKSIGQFRLTSPIGQEPGRAIYRAEEAGTAEPVAVTIIAPPTMDDRWFADRVARGLRSYVGITHPHLIPLREAGEHDGAAFAATPLVAGTTLRARLGSPLPIAEMATLLAPVAAALDALHDRRLVHGDLRPERILLTAGGRVVLTAAGLAPVIADAARLSPGGPGLTPEEAAYRAPESAHGAPSDGRADIYSLGVVAYEALTGRPPFEIAEAGGSAEALTNLHVGTPPPAPRTLNPTLDAATEAALLRALAKSAYERFARATEFIDALAGEAGRPAAEAASAQAAIPAWMAPPAPVAPAITPVAPAPTPIIASYAYAPTPIPPSFAATVDTSIDGGHLAAERARLVNALAAIARRRATPPLTAERQRLVQTLRSATPAIAAGHAPAPRPPAAPPPGPPPAPRPRARAGAAQPRPTPAERAANFRADWYFEYRILPETAALTIAKTYGPLLGIMLFGGIIFSGLRCLIFFAIVGAIACVLSWLTTTRKVIGCDREGFTVTSGFAAGQASTWRYTWADIRSLRYYEKEIGKQKTRTEGHFEVYTVHGKAFDEADTYKYDFDRLIEIFTRWSPHLPYTWVPSDQLRDRPVLERRKFYSKIARVPEMAGRD